jgi:uncharacterized protein
MLSLNINHLYILEWASIFLKDVLNKANVDSGHGIDHALIVLNHAKSALDVTNERLTDPQILAIQLAALLHDADDHKFFHNSDNVNYILNTVLHVDNEENNSIKEMVNNMILLVSCSKNRNFIVKPDWLLIPRWADRLEAIGRIGIQRAIIYNQHNDRPIVLDTTVIANSPEELAVIATVSRFENYKGVSDSLLDHMYDKVLHLSVETGNSYFDKLFKERHEEIVDFCLEFGKNKNVEIILNKYKDEIY